VAKREVSNGVEKFYTLFVWRRCEACGKEFRREPGYSLSINIGLEYGIYVHMTLDKYVCGVCASNPDEAFQLMRKPIGHPIPPSTP
jgi:hypothetical protein